MTILPDVMMVDLALAGVVGGLWWVAPTKRVRTLCGLALVWVGVCEAFGHFYMETVAGEVMRVVGLTS